jgi:predicted PurR-regulated permease PerM
MKTKVHKRVAILTLIAIILCLILWGVIAQRTKLWEIIRFILYAIVLAYVLTPISRRLELYMSRPRATLIVYVAIILFAGFLMFLFVPLLIRQSIALINRLPTITQRIQNIIIKFQREMIRLGIPYGIQITFNEYFDNLDRWFASLVKKKMDGAVDGVGKITAIFTVPVLSYYFTKDREEFKKTILGLIPSRIRRPTLKIAREISVILDRFIRGQILVALIVGTLTTLGYMIIGLPYAIIMGLFMGIFEIVPYFGPVFGAIPAAIIAISYSQSKLFATIIVVIVVQQLESNIFTPKIMGDHVGLHPIYIIVSLWVAGMFFGVIGMFFAVPIVLILRVIIKNVYISIVSSSDWEH